MQVLNLEEKNTERMEAINKFTLMDDTFMTQVFSGDLECTEELLKIILKSNFLSVTKSITQMKKTQYSTIYLKYPDSFSGRSFYRGVLQLVRS